MKKTKVIFILDETGSMLSCREATISGFNEYVKSLQEKKENTVMSLTTFNTNHTTLRFTEHPVKEINPLTNETYIPDALTPLYDAIGQTIVGLTKGEDEEVICVIMTDGEENASKEFTLETINTLLREKEAKGWTFVYLGADHDAWNVGQKFGMSAMNVSNYSKASTKETFDTLACNTVAYCGSTQDFFSEKDKKLMNKEEPC